MTKIKSVRKSGLTFAPEAGTQRLRDVINKNVTEEEIERTCNLAFSAGYTSVKLYFMLGLPTETDEDVLGIADLARKVYFAWRECSPNKARGVRITVSTSWFVPKPHTAFQWEAQITREEYQRRVDLAAGRPEAGQVHHLQLARPGDQLSGGRLLPGRPAAGRRAGVRLAARGQDGLLERVF